MRLFYALGVDPGPTPGLVGLLIRDQKILARDVIQCSHEIAPAVVRGVLEEVRPGAVPTLVQIEAFVVGRASMRAAGPGQTTRDLIGRLHQELAEWEGVSVLERNAANTKPWATDARLEAAGLLEACKGMRHARDAARHALYAAVKDGGLPDPLSKEYRR